MAQNALIHGFAATASATRGADDDRLTALIGGMDASPERLALAREIAVADAQVRRARRVRCVLKTLQADRTPTLEGMKRVVKEMKRTVGLFSRLGEFQRMSKRVYKGRPLKLHNYPRFRGLFDKLAEVPQRFEALEASYLLTDIKPLTAAQARLLDRYEAEALRRRKRAIADFDQLVRREDAAAKASLTRDQFAMRKPENQYAGAPALNN